MTIRAKTIKRLAVIAVVGVVVVAGAGGAVIYKKRVRLALYAQYQQEGLQAYKAADYARVLDRLGNIPTTYYQNNPEVIQALAEANFKIVDPDNRNFKPAMDLYRNLLSQQPDNDDARQKLLNLYLRFSYLADALEMADKILKKFPNDVPALRGRAEALDGLHRYPEAQKTAELLNQVAPLNLEGQFLTLRIMKANNQPTSTLVQRVQALLEKYPKNPGFELLMSEVYRKADDADGVLKWARIAATHKITDPQILRGVVTALDSQKQYAEATAALEKNAAQASDAELFRFWIVRQWQLGRYTAVEQQLSGLVPQAPDADPELLAVRALTLIQLHKLDAAKPIKEALLARGSTNRDALLWGQVVDGVLDPSADPKVVLQNLRLAGAVWPTQPMLVYLQGMVLAKLGNVHAAQGRFESLTMEAPVWAAPVVQLSRIFATNGDLVSAYQYAKFAQQRNPNDPEVRCNLAVLWAAAEENGLTRDRAGLKQLIGEILENNPKEEEIYPAEIRLLLAEGKIPEAKTRLTAILQSTPAPSEETLLRLATVSLDAQLGLTEACLNTSQQAHGLSAKLALRQAYLLVDEKKIADAKKQLSTLRNQHTKDRPDSAWDLVWALFLDRISDPAAKETWTELGNRYPDNLNMQWHILAAPSVAQDHALLGTALERVGKQLSLNDPNLMFLRARWLLFENPNTSEIMEATRILNELIRTDPYHANARLLLAGVLKQQGNTNGAIAQYLAVADLQSRNPAPPLEAAQLMILQGDMVKAQDLVNRALATQTKNPAELKRAAMLLAQLGEADQALLILKALPNEGTEGNHSLGMAILYVHENQLAEAEAVCQKLMAKPDLSIIQFYADLLASRGKTAEAEKVLARAAELSLKPGQKELLLANYQMAHGSVDQALTLFHTATKLAPDNPQTWGQLLVAQVNANRPTEAAVTLRQAAAALPTNSDLQNLLKNADLFDQLGDQPLAKSLLLALVQTSADQQAPVVESLRLLQAAKTSAQPTAATLQNLRKIADRNPRTLSIQLFVSRLYLLLGQYNEAIIVAARATQGFPTAIEPAQQYAVALNSAQRWDEALLAAQEWRHRSLTAPQSADLLIASIQTHRGQPKAALQQLNPYLTAAHANPDQYIPYVIAEMEALFALKQYDQAAAILLPLLDKSAAWRGRWLSFTLHNISQESVSRQWLEQVSPKIPPAAVDEQLELAKAWFGLGEAHNSTAATKRGIQLLTALANRADATANVWLYQGMVLEKQEDRSGAEQAYRKALVIDPNSALVQNNLASLLLLVPNADLNEALNLTNRALKTRPDVATFYDTRASVHVRQKHLDEAVKDLKKAVELEPGNMDWNLNLADILMQAGKSDQARIIRDQIRLLNPDAKNLTDSQRQKLEKLQAALSAPSK